MNQYYEFINTPLPYSFSALEPYIDQKTMEVHHDGHLQSYINRLNAALQEQPDLQNLSLEQLILLPNPDNIPILTTIKNNAGGVYNHRIYFDGMSMLQNQAPCRLLCEAIIRDFGGVAQWEDVMKSAALSVFGSGYAWLTCDCNGTLMVVTTANQDTPLTLELCPIITIDVWEHAYYLKHLNDRASYISNWFHVINWNYANRRYMACLAQCAYD